MSPGAPWLQGLLVDEGDCHLLEPSLVAVPGAPWLQGLMVDEGGRHLPEPLLVIGDRPNAQEAELELDGGAPWLHEKFHVGESDRIFVDEVKFLVKAWWP